MPGTVAGTVAGVAAWMGEGYYFMRIMLPVGKTWEDSGPVGSFGGSQASQTSIPP